MLRYLIHKICVPTNQKKIINYVLLSLIVLFCSLISFLVHHVCLIPSEKDTIITGGLCGLSTIIAKISVLIGFCSRAHFKTVFGHAHFLLNIPVLVIACYFGFRFTFLTILYVSSFYFFHHFEHVTLLNELAKSLVEQGVLTRIVLAALVEGFLEAIIMGIGASSGGIHTIMRYLARRGDHRRLNSLILFFNLMIISVFSLLDLFEPNYQPAIIVLQFIFASMLAYFTKKAVDWYDLRSQEQIQIITKNQQLPSWLITQGWHGATIVTAQGAYTQEPILMIYMTVTTHETKNIISLIQQYDPDCFINVVMVKRLHGHFLTPHFDVFQQTNG